MRGIKFDKFDSFGYLGEKNGIKYYLESRVAYERTLPYSQCYCLQKSNFVYMKEKQKIKPFKNLAYFLATLAQDPDFIKSEYLEKIIRKEILPGQKTYDEYLERKGRVITVNPKNNYIKKKDRDLFSNEPEEPPFSDRFLSS